MKEEEEEEEEKEEEEEEEPTSHEAVGSPAIAHLTSSHAD